VNDVVVLDAGPLGLLANPRRTPQVTACRQWAAKLQAAGRRVIIPEIADYEVRRELVRAGKTTSLAALDAVGRQLEYLPLSTPAMRKAAELWAQARRLGQPTAPDSSLDADVILAAQVLTLGAPNVVVATTNMGHLARYAPAELWQSILP